MIESKIEKYFDYNLDKNRYQFLRQILKDDLTTQPINIPEIETLLGSLKEWYINQELLKNILLKIEFYIPNISENLLKKLFKKKKLNSKRLHLRSYLRVFFLKALGMMLKNLESEGIQFSKMEIVKFFFLMFTMNSSIQGIGNSFGNLASLDKLNAIPIVLTISKLFKSLVIKKINMKISTEKMRIYSKEAAN